MRSLQPLAPMFRRLADLLIRFGSDRGGMFVEARGKDGEGRDVRATWSLVAEGGDGPVIPSLPALAILRRLAAGELAPGATPCVGLLSLDAIEAEFLPYRIETQIRIESVDLFARALSGFDRMPVAVRTGHRTGGGQMLRGRARVDGAESPAGAIVAALFRLPRAIADVPVTVTMLAEGNREIWIRNFGGRRFRSVLAARAWRRPDRALRTSHLRPRCSDLRARPCDDDHRLPAWSDPHSASAVAQNRSAGGRRRGGPLPVRCDDRAAVCRTAGALSRLARARSCIGRLMTGAQMTRSDLARRP